MSLVVLTRASLLPQVRRATFEDIINIGFFTTDRRLIDRANTVLFADENRIRVLKSRWARTGVVVTVTPEHRLEVTI